MSESGEVRKTNPPLSQSHGYPNLADEIAANIAMPEPQWRMKITSDFHTMKNAMNTIAPRPVDAVIAAVREFLGDRLSTAQAIREQHSRGEDQTPPTLPDAVAFVETTEEVSRILALCHRHEVPVVAFGAGMGWGATLLRA